MRFTLKAKEFIEELRDFRSKHEEVEKDCLGPSMNLKKITLNPDVSSYNRYLCGKMLFSEIEYLHYFRRKMEIIKRRTFVNSTAEGIGEIEYFREMCRTEVKFCHIETRQKQVQSQLADKGVREPFIYSC